MVDHGVHIGCNMPKKVYVKFFTSSLAFFSKSLACVGCSCSGLTDKQQFTARSLCHKSWILRISSASGKSSANFKFLWRISFAGLLKVCHFSFLDSHPTKNVNPLIPTAFSNFCKQATRKSVYLIKSSKFDYKIDKNITKYSIASVLTNGNTLERFHFFSKISEANFHWVIIVRLLEHHQAVITCEQAASK